MMKNYWLTKDIRLEKDSQDYYAASHRHQGYLYDWTHFPSRKEARRAAVEELRAKQREEEGVELIDAV